jgi:aminopeptidase YwaD
MVDMFRKVISAVSEEASGERAFEGVSSIARFHRIQASPGFRRAAGYCVDVMLESSENARVIYYPAEDGARFWHFPSFEEWNGRRGILKVMAPGELAGRLADFESCPISLIQRSAPTPRGGLATEIVYAGAGEGPADFRGARGKIAVVDAYAPHTVYDAAVKAGVRGIIIYRQKPVSPVRMGVGLEGIRPYCSFWWDERDLFGFVLTPEDGMRLVSYLRSPAARKHPVKAWALVDGERHPGTMEVVTSLIPGREEKEVVLIAHLCHPQPSAGDNASGAAAVLEVHRLLNELIRAGRLPQPRYGIRFLLVPEISGTFAYLSPEDDPAANLIMGLNLDMVGQKQDVTGSTLCIEKPPMPSASFATYLLSHLAEAQFSAGSNPGSTASVPLVRWTDTPFSGGSDHAVLSDPTVGVPTPMLIQWPDRYYHTSGDMPENVSPDLLGRIVTMAGTCIYLCALADESDLLEIVSLTGRGLRKEAIDGLASLEESPAAEWVTPRYKARVLGSAGKQALKSIAELAPQSVRLKKAIRREEAALRDCLRREAAMASTRRRARAAGAGKTRSRRGTDALASREKTLRELDKIVVSRLVRGPVDPRALMRQLSPAKRARFMKRVTRQSGALMIGTLGLFWADGQRSIAEIARLVAAELGYTDPRFLKFYFGLLKDAGLVEYRSRRKSSA